MSFGFDRWGFVKTDWAVQIEKHGHVVVVALLAQGVRLHDAKDLAQEAWTRLISADANGRLDRIELPGLAIRQALFLAAERRRIDRRRVAVAVEESTCIAGDLEQEVAARQVLGVVAAELGRTTPRAQAVVVSVLNADGPHQAQAATLGLSTQRFRQVLCQVRARLRAVIDEETR